MYVYEVHDRNRAPHIQPHYVDIRVYIHTHTHVRVYIHTHTQPEPVCQIDSLILLLCTCIKFVTEIELVILRYIIYIYTLTKFVTRLELIIFGYIYIHQVRDESRARYILPHYVHIHTPIS